MFSSRYNKDLTITPTFTFGDTTIGTTKSVKNLGVLLDNQLNFNNQVNLMCKKAMLAIRSIGRIKKYLTRDNLAKLVNSFVTPATATAPATAY